MDVQWRLLYNLVKEQDDNNTVNEVMLKLKIEQLHQLRIDEKQEEKLKSLSAELKHLYTAVTRARMNLWIYDEGLKECKPFFCFCLTKKLAKLVDADEKSIENLMFAAPSPSEQWVKQGDYYFSYKNWDLAVVCYERGNDNHKKYLTKAYKLIEEAHRRNLEDCYEKAGRLFLCANECKHSMECIDKATKCFQKAGLHAEAAELLERMQNVSANI